LVGNFVDLDGNLEIFSPIFSRTSGTNIYFITDLTPLSLRITADPAPLSYLSKAPKPTAMLRNKIASSTFLIGKSLYQAEGDLAVPSSQKNPFSKTLLLADTLMKRPNLYEEGNPNNFLPNMQIRSHKDIIFLKVAWKKINKVLSEATSRYFSKTKDPSFEAESFSDYLSQNPEEQTTITNLEDLRLLKASLHNLGLKDQAKATFKQELMSLLKPDSIPKSEWNKLIQQ